MIATQTHSVDPDALASLFARQASLVASEAASLRRALDGGPGLGQAIADVLAYDEAAGRIALRIIEGSLGTSPSPIDRGLAKDLATAIDDAADEMRRVADSVSGGIRFRRVAAASAVADRVVLAADTVAGVMPNLEGINGSVAEVLGACDRVDASVHEVFGLQQAEDARAAAEPTKADTENPGAGESRHAYDLVIHGLGKALDRLGDVTTILRDIAYENA